MSPFLPVENCSGRYTLLTGALGVGLMIIGALVVDLVAGWWWEGTITTLGSGWVRLGTLLFAVGDE